jgi:hypothetical protein
MSTKEAIVRYPVGAAADIIKRSRLLSVVIKLCGYIIYAPNLRFTSFVASGLLWDDTRDPVG